ncbi:hypothetical protein KY348_02705 [Candidatus Woesearchaeota archaeon]|nr:hypothetical protein [Candidatus Woesearchaeota archaeon]
MKAKNHTKQDPDERIKAELEQKNWQRAGHEYTEFTKLDKSGLFKTSAVKSLDEIKKTYLEKYGSHGFNEVRIEPAHNPITGEEIKGKIYVYLRRSDKPEKE